MRLWKTSYARRAPNGNAGLVSVCTHAVIIAAWVTGTLPSSSLPPEGLANRVYYIPPPDRPATPHGSTEAVRYLTLSPGIGFGPGPTDIDARRPSSTPERSIAAGEQKVDSAPPVPATVGLQGADSVFTVLEVDSAVVRSESSAAPAYPLELIAKRIEGSVVARYVVDTTGFADTSSFEVLRATDAAFIRAVREALPYMRFSPAKIGVLKVKQLVEQGFTFRITPTPAAASKP